MGLDIGIISFRYLERPQGRAYKFAWKLAEEASVNGYTHGDGNSWGGFTKEGVQAMLTEFTGARGLSAQEQAEVSTWVASLPWNNDLIELHFNW